VQCDIDVSKSVSDSVNNLLASAVAGAAQRSSAESRVIGQTGHGNMLQLIQLRWFAVVGQILSIIVAVWIIGIQLPLPGMLTVLVCLVAFNLSCQLRWHEEREVSERTLLFSLLVDVSSLTAQLYFSGGISNPFVFLYLLQVILAVLLCRTRSAWTVASITALCIVGLAIRYEPLQLPNEWIDHFTQLYAAGLIIAFALDAFLLVFFMTRIARNQRAGDEQVALLREEASEREQVMRIGLLASGAAHELGTPLATMSVILGDWRHDPLITENEDLAQELDELQVQLQRCKQIVTGILLSAGEARGEQSRSVSLRSFTQDVLRQWGERRSPGHLKTLIPEFADLRVAADDVLRQMLFNVLDNAFDASPGYVEFELALVEADIAFTIRDTGPGFAEDILRNAGRPYNSTKGRNGGGLGLFLVYNVARSLGGAVTISNRATGGAQVVIQIPMRSLAVEEGGDV
jgi:two-component system sensor histidine kinase RegB